MPRTDNKKLVMDLGTFEMRLLQLESAQPGEVNLKNLYIQAAPREFVVSTFIENPIMEGDPVKKAIKEITKNIKGGSRDVLVLMPDHSALINLMIAPPRYSKKEQEEAVREDLAPIMPLPIEHWNLIYQSVGTWEDDEITVAMATVKQNLLEVGGFIQEAGLNPQVMEVNFFNVANLIDHYISSADNKGKNICLVHLGNENTSVGVFRDGQVRTFLNRPVGGYDFTKKISKHFHVPEGEADVFKRTEIFFLPEASPEQDSLYNFSVIKDAFGILTREIFSALETFLSKYREFSIHEIIVSGGGANFQNISVMLGSNMNTVVRPISDFYSAYLQGEPLDAAQKNSLAPACGAYFRE
jgi:type IV pilus assembly protein PilM